MIHEQLKKIIEPILKELEYDIAISIKKSNLCDYQCDDVFKLAKQYRKSPIEIGTEIVTKINEDNNFSSYFEKVEFSPPGFINMTLSASFINQCLKNMNDHEQFQLKKPDKQETFVIDYGGYNIAKPLHIGHLRPTIVGESIKRIINYVGHRVIADVHLGDYGLQMGQTIYGILRDNMSIEDIDINYLNRIYPEISALCKSDDIVKEECARITKELQEGSSLYKKYWDRIYEVSLLDIRDICQYLGISFDLWQGEIDSYQYLESVEKLLQEKNLLELSEGALVVNVKKESDNKPMPPMMFKKSNGAYVYGSTDLATIYERKQKFNPDHMIYVTDFRQNLHFEQVFRASDLAGLIPYHSLEHAYNGTINGKDGKPFKTRQGGAPKLRELFDLVKETFIGLKETNKDMSKEDIDIVVNAIIKFADLQNSRDKDYIFDVEKFSEVVGKTGPYVLYTYLRLNKIISNEKIDDNLSNFVYNVVDRNLRLKLLELPDAIERAFTERMPSHIVDYIYNLAVCANNFYQNNHINNCEDSTTKNDWLYIINLTTKILKEMLALVAIDIPTMM